MKRLNLSLCFCIVCGACAGLEHKSIATGATVSAVRVESGAGMTSGQPLPNILLGGSAIAYASSPLSDSERTVHVEVERTTLIDKIFGLGTSDRIVIHIGR